MVLNSCCFKGNLNNYGIQRTENVDRFTKNARITTTDTLILYEKTKICFGGQCYATEKEYLRFYPNGKVSSFINVGLNKRSIDSIKEHSINRKDFNPEKSRMGYYYQKDDKAYIALFVINQCAAEWFKGELVFKNNHLIVKNLKRNVSDSVIYKVKEVPLDLLTGWNPDW